jgi:hypothetical protein
MHQKPFRATSQTGPHHGHVLLINQGMEVAILTDMACLQLYNGEPILTVIVLLVREVRHERGGLGMADKKGLGIFGFILGGVTVAVALVAAVTVQTQINAGMTPAAVNPHTLTFPLDRRLH